MKHSAAIFSREETSPDGSLAISYNYSEGEKSPTIVEPNVTVAATGEVLFDLWGKRLNGHLDDFTAAGFRLTVSDNFNLAKRVVRVDVSTRSFTVIDDPAAPRPLTVMSETLFWMIEHARNEHALASKRPAIVTASFLSRLARWLK